MRDIEFSGCFERPFINALFERLGRSIPEDTSLIDPTLQRQVARLSVMQAHRIHDNEGDNPVEVFKRRVPNLETGIVDEITYAVDFNDATQETKMDDLYRKMVGFERSGDSVEIVRYLDDFTRKL